MLRRALPVILLLVGLVACGGSDTAPSLPSVTYTVTGSTPEVAITYANATEGTSQVNAATPWTLSFTCTKAGQFLYVSAQNQRNSGSVTVRITKAGTTYKESTSSGAFVIATASGDCG